MELNDLAHHAYHKLEEHNMPRRIKGNDTEIVGGNDWKYDYWPNEPIASSWRVNGELLE